MFPTVTDTVILPVLSFDVVSTPVTGSIVAISVPSVIEYTVLRSTISPYSSLMFTASYVAVSPALTAAGPSISNESTLAKSFIVTCFSAYLGASSMLALLVYLIVTTEPALAVSLTLRTPF